MFRKWIALLLSTLFMLAACHSPVYNQAEGNIADVKIKAAQARHYSDNSAKISPSLLVKPGLYVDTTPVSLERRPSWLENHVVIRGDQLPFSYYSRTVGSGAGNNILTKYQTGLDPAVSISINYSGTIKGALDLLAAKTGYTYIIHSNSIMWLAYVTRTFQVAFMPGASDYMMGKQSGGTSSTSTAGAGSVLNFTSGDTSDAEYSNFKGTLSVWTDLENTIKQLLSPDGKVVVSQATTTITVRDRPSNVDLVGQYIANMNSSMSQQVLVKVQVLQVDLSNDYSWGVNWGAIVNAFKNSPFVLNANYGTPLSITSLTQQTNIVNGAAVPGGFPNAGIQKTAGSGIPGYTILFNALNQQGKTSVVTEPRVVCLNNQVSVIRITSTEGYVQSVQNTTVASTTSTNVGTVTSQITPGSIATGLTLYILPKILKDKIYLQVNADLSLLTKLVTFGSTDSSTNTTSVQLPTVAAKSFNQRSVIHSGDTLILSGFREVANAANANQFVTSQALGGKGASQSNTETVVLITPYVLKGSV